MTRPNGPGGRFMSPKCLDPNCGGSLFLEQQKDWPDLWRCDGLTHRTDCDALVACDRVREDGDDVHI